MVIIDAKLSRGTKFTSGQQAGANHVGNNIAYKANKVIKEDIDGVELDEQIIQGTLIKIKNFFKAFEEDGLTNYIN